jgi:lipopolysaccharide biosynthesis glycosyltransferase
MFLGPDIANRTAAELACVQETGSSSSFNSGVMLLNRDYMTCRSPELVEFVRERGFYDQEHRSFDQVFLNRFFAGVWDALPLEFNWRPWQGISSAAQIVHFHGPKPKRIDAIINGHAGPAEEHLRERLLENREEYEHYVALYASYLAKAPALEAGD